MAWNPHEGGIPSRFFYHAAQTTLGQSRSPLASRPLWVAHNTSSCSFMPSLLLSKTLYPLKERWPGGGCRGGGVFFSPGVQESSDSGCLVPKQHLPMEAVLPMLSR